MTVEIEVIGVKWDDEGKSGLPSTVTINAPDFLVSGSEELDEYISDELSNKYGFTHYGWNDLRWVLPTKRELQMNEQQIEKEIQEKGLNAPRLTPDKIDAVISSEGYLLKETLSKQ